MAQYKRLERGRIEIVSRAVGRGTRYGTPCYIHLARSSWARRIRSRGRRRYRSTESVGRGQVPLLCLRGLGAQRRACNVWAGVTILRSRLEPPAAFREGF